MTSQRTFRTLLPARSGQDADTTSLARPLINVGDIVTELK